MNGPVILIGGPQGASKDTQAVILHQRTGLAYIGTGNMCRLIGGQAKNGEQEAEGIRLRKLIHDRAESAEWADAAIMNICASAANAKSATLGSLVDDTYINPLIAWRTNEDDCANGYMLVGAPRSEEQAPVIDRMCRNRGMDMRKVVYALFTVPDDIAIERIARRALEENRPDDAISEVIQRRLTIFRQKNKLLWSYYKSRGRLVEVDASGTREEVAAQFWLKLQSAGIELTEIAADNDVAPVPATVTQPMVIPPASIISQIGRQPAFATT